MHKKTNIGLMSMILLTALSCNRNPYRATNKMYYKKAKTFANTLKASPTGSIAGQASAPFFVGTTNFNLRKPNYVIIHHTAQNSCDQTLKTFTTVRTQVSAHYVICKDGTVHHMLNDYLRAWHGGIAKWGSLADINSSSIGIELDNNGFENFDQRQMSSLLTLLDTLKHNYNIPVANFIGHGDIAPTRKSDPNVTFPWQQLADKGFGLWFSDTTNLQPPMGLNTLMALRIIGYDVRDSSAAKLAFNRHFLAETSQIIDEPKRKILYSVMLKAL